MHRECRELERGLRAFLCLGVLGGGGRGGGKRCGADVLEEGTRKAVRVLSTDDGMDGMGRMNAHMHTYCT